MTQPEREPAKWRVDSELVRDVCALLHSRGREATAEQVNEWLAKMRQRLKAWKGIDVPETEICHAVLDGQKTMTMCLHLHFGDAL